MTKITPFLTLTVLIFGQIYCSKNVMFTGLSFCQVTKVFRLLYSFMFIGLIWSYFFGHLNNPHGICLIPCQSGFFCHFGIFLFLSHFLSSHFQGLDFLEKLTGKDKYLGHLTAPDILAFLTCAVTPNHWSGTQTWASPGSDSQIFDELSSKPSRVEFEKHDN